MAPVEIHPQPRIWLSAIAGQTAESRLLLHRHDGQALHIKSLDVNNPELIEAHFKEVTTPQTVDGLEARPGDVWLEVSLKPQQEPISRGTRVNLTTDVPEEKLVNIPVTIRLRPRVEAIPPQVQIALPPEGGKGAQRQLHIRNNAGGKLRVLGVTSDHPEYFTAEVVSRDASADQVVIVRLTDRAAMMDLSTRVYGKLVVTTDDPAAKEILVPMVLWRVPKRRPVPPGQSRIIRRSVVPTPPGGAVLHADPGKPAPVEKPAETITPTPLAR